VRAPLLTLSPSAAHRSLGWRRRAGIETSYDLKHRFSGHSQQLRSFERVIILAASRKAFEGGGTQVATLGNALTLIRFGGPHFHHFGGRGSGTVLFLIGLVFAAVLIWAITRPRHTVN